LETINNGKLKPPKEKKRKALTNQRNTKYDSEEAWKNTLRWSKEEAEVKFENGRKIIIKIKIKEGFFVEEKCRWQKWGKTKRKRESQNQVNGIN